MDEFFSYDRFKFDGNYLCSMLSFMKLGIYGFNSLKLFIYGEFIIYDKCDNFVFSLCVGLVVFLLLVNVFFFF